MFCVELVVMFVLFLLMLVIVDVLLYESKGVVMKFFGILKLGFGVIRFLLM